MKKLIIPAFLLLVSAGAFAQNLNPVVEVTNAYQREAGGIEKPSQLLAMPDSVLHFNWDIDYSVRSTPYQGSYEFRPYLVQLRPMPRVTGENRLFLRAGAGYGLHPEATVIWTPVSRSNFRLNLFGDHYSYFGAYRNLVLDSGRFVSDGMQDGMGADSHTAAGADVIWGWDGGEIQAAAGYKNIYAKDALTAFSNNIGFLNARVKGKAGDTFSYEVGTRLAYHGVALPSGLREEFVTRSHALLGAQFGVHHVNLDLGFQSMGREGNMLGDISVTPRYILNINRFRFNLGVKMQFLVRTDDPDAGVATFTANKSDWVYPDAYLAFDAIPEKLVLQAAATGGDQLNVLSDILEKNAFMGSMQCNAPDDFRFRDYSSERFNLMVGARGNLAERFHYDLKVGYSYRKESLEYAFTEALLPSVGVMEDYHQFYTDLELGWKADYLDVDGHLLLRKTTIEEDYIFAPALLSGQLKALYIWGGRLRAGVTLDAQTDRISRVATVPGYVDLGLYGDFQMSRTVGVWLRVGNLLNQSVQLIPLYAQRGIYFSVGAKLTL